MSIFLHQASVFFYIDNHALWGQLQPQSEKETELLVMWCRRGGLEEEADTLCRTRANYWRLRGASNYGAVAYWLTRARHDIPYFCSVDAYFDGALERDM